MALENEQMPKVSVIVPVYNKEKYLGQCMDSIVNQTLKEIEIICVDDGSTDASLDILKSYQEKDPRVSVYHQQNKYAGAARNTGKAHAKGKYLVFWDSDDYFELNALERMYEKSEEDGADVCVCNGKQFLEDAQIEFVHNYVEKNKLPEQIPFNRLTHPKYILNFTTESPWNKMFLRSYIEAQGLDFQEVRNGNDVYFVASAICLADKVTVVNEPLICYRKNQADSLVGTLSKSPLTPLKAWIAVAENLKARDAFPKESFVNKAMSSVFYSLHNISEWESFKECVNFLKTEGLERLSIEIMPDEDYYTGWHKEAITHLMEDSPEQFAVYFQNLTYKHQSAATAKRKVSDEKNRVKYNKLNKRFKKLQKEMEQVKSSVTWKIGRIFTWLPGKLKSLFSSK